MPALTFLNHLLNLIAPAVFLALLLGLGARVVWRGGTPLLPLGEQLLVNTLLGVVVLGAGVVWWGRDGRLATYAVLVLLLATSQWLMVGGWRSASKK